MKTESANPDHSNLNLFMRRLALETSQNHPPNIFSTFSHIRLPSLSRTNIGYRVGAMGATLASQISGIARSCKYV